MKAETRTFRVAAIQPELIAGEPEQNAAKAIRMTRKAAARGAKMILLPELFITGFDYDCIENYSAKRRGAVLQELRSIAREKEAVIIAGSVAVRSSGQHSRRKMFNISYIINANGRTIAHYEKMHLFPLMHEDIHFTAGDKPVCAKTSYGFVAPCICYDIRFPELIRRLMHLNTEVLAVPAEFPHPRLEHWRTLLRARAIENQFFVLAANRVGEDATGSYFGHSMIIDPSGHIVAEAGEEEEILLGTIDVAVIEKTRQAIPSVKGINPAVRLEGVEGSLRSS